jgi:nicotinamidase-related amidase
MQKDSFMFPAHDKEGVIKRINILSDTFRKKGDKVIFIQHDGSIEGSHVPSTEGWEILPSMDRLPDDLVISKTANDSFYRTTLKDELLRLRVDELVITGTATDFCIDATVKSALVNDFNITVIADAHTTEDKPNLTAKQLIDHYNWVWQALAPAKFKIKVIDFEHYLGGSR